MECFTKSDNIKLEYCCQVVRIGKVIPIEGSDFLARTIVSGNSIVVRKDEFKEGDYAIYAKNETALNDGFLSANNLFELSEFKRNSNANEVERLIADGKKDEAKRLTGFFNKYGRVRAIKLRNVYSMGFIFTLENLAKWKPEVSGEDLSSYIVNSEMGIGENFDTVCGEIFVKTYMPPIPKRHKEPSGKHEKKRQKRIKMFERISDSEWRFHYDTLMANDNIWMIDPDDTIDITVKEHGTSGIFANMKVKCPSKLSLIEKFINYAARKTEDLSRWINKFKIPEWNECYGNVYSSRTVIKNKYINNDAKSGYYGNDVWGKVNETIMPYLDKGMTVYGEICGYIDGSTMMIQKNYDYCCEIGTNYFMPYRITTVCDDGTTREWSVMDVVEWTRNLIIEHHELNGKIRPMEVLYHGKASGLYPDIQMDGHWHENVLEAMKNDREHFGMEGMESLCKNKVPREGICIRVENKPGMKAMKLKSYAFYDREKKQMDNGETNIEMTS